MVGASEKVLIQRLRELVSAGVLTRRDHQRVPPMVDDAKIPFELTLAAALMPLGIWGNEHPAAWNA